MLNLIVVSLQGMSFLSGFFIFGILQFHFDVFEISFTYPVWDSLCFLNLKGLVFDQFWKILSHCLIIYCFFCFFSFSHYAYSIQYTCTICPHVSQLSFHISFLFGLLSVISVDLPSSLLILSLTVCNVLFNPNIGFGFSYIFLFLEVLLDSFSKLLGEFF